MFLRCRFVSSRTTEHLRGYRKRSHDLAAEESVLPQGCVARSSNTASDDRSLRQALSALRMAEPALCLLRYCAPPIRAISPLWQRWDLPSSGWLVIDRWMPAVLAMSELQFAKRWVSTLWSCPLLGIRFSNS